jgi:sulfite reductase alpha subunit-like flavoprotein
MMACLLPEIRIKRERMKARPGADIKTIREKMDAWLEEMRAWLKKTTACQKAMEVCLEKAKANPGRTKACREEMEAVAERKSLKKRPQWKLSEHWRTDISHRAPPTAEETDPGR